MPENEKDMVLPRDITFEPEAIAAMLQILGILTDQLSETNMKSEWDLGHIVDLETRLFMVEDDGCITLGITDAALILTGMAFTEVMSQDLPWIDMVRWTADFISTELRQYWTDEEWNQYAAR